MVKKISKDMMIMDAIHKNPKTADILMEAGIHCIGCVAASGETLEQGLKAHGKKDKEIDELIDEVNKDIDKDKK